MKLIGSSLLEQDRQLKKFSAGNHYTNATDVISGLKTERAKIAQPIGTKTRS